MKGIKGLKRILQIANKKLSSDSKFESKKIQIRLVDPNRLNYY
ncbi:MAG TPA: hypothetical protein VIH28_03155 [Ignavibacteriaceae bacterium]